MLLSWYNLATMAPRRAYVLRNPIPNDVHETLATLPALTRSLLYHRDIADLSAAERFLSPRYDEHLHDPFLLTDMERAVERTLRAMRDNEHIVIYSDYDCDGIPGGVILHDLFDALGYSNFENYIPHRHEEGYGFNAASVAKFAERETKLIITVDCGIVDHEAADRARELGIDVIVTDHHEPSDTLPRAFAVVNPKRDDAYPFKGICGAAVAYKLAQAIITRGKETGAVSLSEGREKWFLDMVGLATIADMVPLTDENRVFAQYGLMVLRKSRRPGLQHLLKKAGVAQRHLTEDDIGFTIAPRINAASRMDDPEDAFHMLRTRDEADAGARVEHLEHLNNERRGVVAAMVKEAKKRMHAMEALPPVIVMGNPEWRPSLVGLVASSLAEAFRRPTFLWGRDGRNIIKGSCRSSGTISTLRLMEAAADAFIAFGGHHESGGFSVADDKVHTLMDMLINAHNRLVENAEDIEHELLIDAELSLDEVDETLLTTLRTLAPYGEGNPKPLFRFSGVRPHRVDVFGKAKNHTKLRFNTENGPLDAIAFFKTPEQFEFVPEAGKELTLIAHVEESFFMGRKETRLRLVDII